MHVDKICKREEKYKQYWIPMAISLMYYANQYLQEISRADLTGVTDMPLYANEKFMMGFNFKKIEDIRAEFGVPPLDCLYTLGSVTRYLICTRVPWI